MNKLWVSLVAGLMVVTTTPAADNKKEVERVENSGTVISEILDIPDDIPQSLLDKSKAVIVLPQRFENRLHRWRKLRPGRHDLPHR